MGAVARLLAGNCNRKMTGLPDLLFGIVYVLQRKQHTVCDTWQEGGVQTHKVRHTIIIDRALCNKTL